MRLTLKQCLKCNPLSISALSLTNKIAFKQSLGNSIVDNNTYWSTCHNICSLVRKLHKQIINNEYKFSQLYQHKRRVKRKDRIIYLSTWQDKIVERWLNDSLNRLLNNWFNARSYAYRTSDIGLDKCQHKIAINLRSNPYIIKKDISQYFYTINHDILLSQLSSIIKHNDPLYDLILQRVKFNYIEHDTKLLKQATIGVPFGSSIACILANIYLTDLDNKLTSLPIQYHRYADDIIILAPTQELQEKASQLFDNTINDLKLHIKPSHNITTFLTTNSIKHLGLEFYTNGTIKLPIEKFRKINNMFKRILSNIKVDNLTIEQRIIKFVDTANYVINNRIRSAAVIDYYLKHVNDERQLKELDKLIMQHIISGVLQKKFKYSDYKTIAPSSLRNYGLQSLLHRNRLIKHGHLKISFLSLYNKIMMERHQQKAIIKKQLINLSKLAKKLKHNDTQPKYQQT